MKNKSYISELYAELMRCIPECGSIEEATRMAQVSKSKLKIETEKNPEYADIFELVYY